MVSQVCQSDKTFETQGGSEVAVKRKMEKVAPAGKNTNDINFIVSRHPVLPLDNHPNLRRFSFEHGLIEQCF